MPLGMTMSLSSKSAVTSSVVMIGTSG